MTDVTTGAEASQARLRLVRSPTEEGPLDPDGGQAVVTPPASSTDVINLREAGRSYAAIARKLTMPGSIQAQAAFIKAVRHRPQQERLQLVERELGRLDNLEKKIRAGTDQDPNKTSQQLAAVEKLRSALQ